MHLSGLERQWEWFKLRGRTESHYPSYSPAFDHKGILSLDRDGALLCQKVLPCGLENSACLTTRQPYVCFFFSFLYIWKLVRATTRGEGHVACSEYSVKACVWHVAAVILSENSWHLYPAFSEEVSCVN